MATNKVEIIIDGNNIAAIKSIDGVETKLKGLGNTARSSGGLLENIFGSVSSIAAAAGIGLTGAALFSFGKDAITASAQLGVLRDNFKGTTQDLELFQRATAGTVTEASLLKLSNQATDLGLSIKQQAILLSLAEDAADKYGGGVEENFQRVLKASEGGTKGLKDLGIQKAIYDDIVKSYLNDYGVKNLNQLDSETQKWIQVEAMIKATGVTLDDIAKKLPDAADKIEAIGVKWDRFKNKSGEVLLPVLGSILDAIVSVDDWAIKAGNDLDRMIGLKGILGNGDQSKPPDDIKNRADLDNALSHLTYVKNGKLITQELIKEGKLSAEEIEKRAKEASDKAKKFKEDEAKYLKQWNDSIYKSSLDGLDVLEKGFREAQRRYDEARKQFGQKPQFEDMLSKDKASVVMGIYAEMGTNVMSIDDMMTQKMHENSIKRTDDINAERDKSIELLFAEYENRKNSLDLIEEVERQRVQITADSFGMMADSMDLFYQAGMEKSRIYFDAYKVFAIAQAVVSGKEAVMHSYKEGTKWGGPVLGAAFAAAAGIFAAAQIASIASSQPAAISAPVAKPPKTSDSTTNNINQKNVNMTLIINSEVLAGDSLDKWMRDKLSVSINKAINDGVIDLGNN